MFISLIFPCHNEEQAIPQLLPKVLQAKKDLLKTSKLNHLEILVVDDGSKDQSLEKLQAYKEEMQIVSLKTQEGYGAAIQKGIKQSKGDWIAFCDLDNTCDPKDLKLLMDLVDEKSLSASWGNRLHKKSQMPWIRRLGNLIYQWVFLFFSFRLVPDPCSGFRLFKKSAFIEVIDEFPKNLSFSLAFTAHCVRYRIPFRSQDISYKERLGTSKLRVFKDGFVFLFVLIQFLFFKKYRI